MQKIYEEYGFYKEGQFSLTMKGMEGAKEIEVLMTKIRTNPPKAFGAWTVRTFRDYKTGRTLDLTDGTEGTTGLPESNVLYFDLTDDAWCCVRPSGTEPKIKFYFYSIQDSAEKAAEVNKKIKDEVFAMVQSVE